MSEELASVREVVDLSPPQALDEAEYFLVGQGYIVVNRTATTLTVEREVSEGTTGQEGVPKLLVIAVPQPEGGVRIKVRGDDREGVREQQPRWIEWEKSLPKRMTPPSVRVTVVRARGSGRAFSRLPRNTIIVVAVLAALAVVGALAGFALAALSGPEDATEVVQALEDEGLAIGETRTFTAETDSNGILGRPGQYTSKATFYDTRLKPAQFAKGFDVMNGGTVEVFENEDDTIRRKEYVDTISEGFSNLGGEFAEYSFREGAVLLRVSGRLTPEQADEYEAALKRAM